MSMEQNHMENEDVKKTEEKEPKQKMGGKIKASFTSRKFKSGAYATVVSIVVIAIVIVVNLFTSKLNRNIDLSSNAMYSLSKTSKDYIKGIQDDITIYYMISAGNENKYIKTLGEEYANSSSHIKFVCKDPELYPQFASQYIQDPEEQKSAGQNSIIVVNETKNTSKYIPANEVILTQMDYSTYQQHQSGDFEGRVTSALEYLTLENLPIYYHVTGHGEAEVGSVMKEMFDKNNIEIKEIETLKETEIPKDCTALVISAPATDYSDDEIKMIQDYLSAGGKAIITATYQTASCPNFIGLLNNYGIGLVEGCIVEGDASHMVGQSPLYGLLNLNQSADILGQYTSTSEYLIYFSAIGIQKLDTVRSSVKITDLLTTSEEAYSKVNMKATTLEKEEGDIDGPFSVGVDVKEEYDGKETELIVLSDPCMIDEQYLANTSLANYNFMSTIVGTFKEEATVSIPAVSFDIQSLTVTNAAKKGYLTVFLFLIPASILVVGGVVVYKRRKR